MPYRLSSPAPSRVWHKNPNGLWSSAPWTPEEMAEYRAAGGWFGGDTVIAKICRQTPIRTTESIEPEVAPDSPLARGGKTVKTHRPVSADSLGLFDLFFGDVDGQTA